MQKEKDRRISIQSKESEAAVSKIIETKQFKKKSDKSKPNPS